MILPLRNFVAERAKTARAFLKQLDLGIPLAELEISELNEHTPSLAIESFLAPISRGKDLGLMSEAGCPAVADPGSLLVAAAHRHGIEVLPLVGPSSILLTLMASGLNGQRFGFEGYLPVDRAAREKALKDLEQRSQQQHSTQLWIETPYRAQAMLASCLQSLHPTTQLCIAQNLTLAEQSIQTRSIAQWRERPPTFDKPLVVFALLAQKLK